MQRPAESTYFRYPGPGHVLRYLRLACDGRQSGVVEGLMPALPDLTDPSGAMRLGAIGLLVDYAAGMLALQTVQPDWTVTHDLSLHLTGLAPPQGELESTTRVVRAGKTSVISETSVATPSGIEVARGQVTFSRVARREGTPGASSKLLVNLAEPEADEAPRRPLDEAVGFRFSAVPPLQPGHHFVEFDHIAFVHNSLGAIQGGVIALSIERAASWAAAAELGAPCRTTDVRLHYLALGKKGPFKAQAEVLRRDPTSVVSRIALVDTGDGNRILALGAGTAALI